MEHAPTDPADQPPAAAAAAPEAAPPRKRKSRWEPVDEARLREERSDGL
jgi:hypothetical protein